jgi:hypothetical protein
MTAVVPAEIRKTRVRRLNYASDRPFAIFYALSGTDPVDSRCFARERGAVKVALITFARLLGNSLRRGTQ